jgi:hypothetical protein
MLREVPVMKQTKTILVIILASFSFAIPFATQAVNQNCGTLLRALQQHETHSRYFEIANLTLNAPNKHAPHLFSEGKSRFARVLLVSGHPGLVCNPEKFILDNVRQIFREVPDLALIAVVLTHQNPSAELLDPLLIHAREHLTRISADLEFPQGAQFTPDYNAPVDEAKMKVEKQKWLANMKRTLETALKSSSETIELGIPEDEKSSDEIIDLLAWASKRSDFGRIKVVWTSVPKIPLDRMVYGHSHVAEPRDWSKTPDFGSTAFLDQKISEEDFLTENAIAYLIVFGNEGDLRLIKGLAEMKFNSLYELFLWRLNRREPGFPN